MPIKIRQIRGPRKAGEKLTFATLPTGEAKVINSQTLRRKFNSYYGPKADYKFLAEQVRDFSVQDSRERVIPVLLVGKEEEERYQLEATSHYLMLKKVGKRERTIALVPAPAVHDVRYYSYKGKGRNGGGFDAVLNILENGFAGGHEKDDNAVIKRGRSHRNNEWDLSFGWKDKITRGDNYSFELFSEEGQGSYARRNTKNKYNSSWKRRGKIGEGEDEVTFNYGIHYASPRRVLSLNIRLNPESSDKEKLKKMEFYKKEVADKYNIPVRFYETSGKIIRSKGKEWIDHDTYKTLRRIIPKTLEGKVGGIIAIIGLLGGTLFLSYNLTGNVIGSSSTDNFIGAVLFLVGVVGTFFYFRKRR